MDFETGRLQLVHRPDKGTQLKNGQGGERLLALSSDLATRRNNVRFQKLRELGVNLVERKGGIRIRFDDYDLDMHWREAQREYAERHEEHCVGFVREVLERADRTELAGRSGLSRAEFVEYLDTGVVERDFGELF